MREKTIVNICHQRNFREGFSLKIPFEDTCLERNPKTK